MRNYGLKVDEPKDPNAYVFGGGNVPMEILQEDGDWTQSLPVKAEFQNLNKLEPFACVIFSLLNCSEILIKKQYGEERNYSERFLAIITNTRNGGTSPHYAAEMLRKFGLVSQEKLPFDETIDTLDKFFSPIPKELYDLAKEFLEEFEFKHEDVPRTPEAITAALKCSPLQISVPAWYERNGKFYRPDGIGDNHAVTMFCERPNEFRRIADSYDHPYIKDVEWGVMPIFIKRFWIKKRVVEVNKQISRVSQAIDAVKKLIAYFFSEKITPAQEQIVKQDLVKLYDKTAEDFRELQKIMDEIKNKYKWGNRDEVRHSCRVIMDEYGLKWAEKDLLCACIQQESQFDTKAIGKKNKNGTQDFGLCQFNNGKNKQGVPYWIGDGATFKNTDEVLNNPEKCVRIMIREYKAGHLNYWASYSSGAYKKYL